MHLIPKAIPTPRLLSSAALAHEREKALADSNKSRLKRGGLGGNGLWLFGGLLAGGALIVGIGLTFSAQRHAQSKFVSVATKSLSDSPRTVKPPAPIIVQIDADLLRVTAIALGELPLAVINGRQVAEGDELILHTPTAAVAVTLQVIKIQEGRIDLTDGVQVLTARLRAPGMQELKR